MTRASLLAFLSLAIGCNPDAGKPARSDPQTQAQPDPAPEPEDEPGDGPSNSPVSLTASDGTGLTIVAFEARAVVQDPLAFTELHLTFKNPEARQIEGQFEITLPPSATLSRFAMKQAWGWQEGEVVELQAARRAYEDFLHRRQDPALLEKQPGNQFHARVFPIAPSGEKEIILSYSEELVRAGEPYRVHLRGLPKVARLDVQAIVGRREKAGAASSLGGSRFVSETVQAHKQDFQPDADFVVPLPAITQQPQAGLRSGELVVARVTPVASSVPDPIDAAHGLYVLFDTSASRALGFPAQVARLGEIVHALAAQGADVPLKVVAFDQQVEPIYEGTLGGFDEAARGRLLAREALGASDLGAALAQVAGDKKYARLLLFTDGIATAGATDEAALRKAVAALGQAGVGRLDVVVSGGIRDADRLAALTTAGLPRDGVVVDATKRPESIARRLTSAALSHIAVKVPGATWVWPTELRGLQPRDQALVYASLPAGQAMVVDLDGPIGPGGATTHFSYPVALTEVERPLLERASVAAQIRRLQTERVGADAKRSGELRQQIVALSTKFRVLCDETALLVLETEADYARFQIDRRALVDILTVGAGGVEVLARRGAVPQPHALPSDPQAQEEKKPKLLDRDDEGGPPTGAMADEKEKGKGDEGKMGRTRGTFDREEAEQRIGRILGAPAATPSAFAPAPVAAPAEAFRGVDGLDLRGAGGVAVHGVGGGGSATRSPPRIALPDAPPPPVPEPESEQFLKRARVDPYEGKLKEVMMLLQQKKLDLATKQAWAWHAADRGDVLALIALGEVAEHRGDRKAAARAYGSLIDLFPGRADLRRFAGERLERLGDAGLPLAVDTYRKARDQRPDHPASHRLLAFALLRSGDYAGAFEAIAAGAKRGYPDGRFLGVDRILIEDVGLVAAAWLRQTPKARAEILALVAKAGATLPSGPSLRFILNWETDANDVDFHILDAKGGHAYFSNKQLASGGELYADVTTGYGPECFTIPGKPQAYPYKLQAHYYSRGPMGYGMGKLQIIQHDGQGGLRFEDRPFVIMTDGAYVDMGEVKGPL